jgi:HSP20 family molecular chaperone IbpA
MKTNWKPSDVVLEEVLTTPRADLLETHDEYLLFMDLPGVSKDTLSIKVREGVLSVTGAPEQTGSSGEKLLYGEVIHGTYHRDFRIAEDVVDIDKATAHLENGVLSMILPKNQKYRERRIPVRRVA